VKPGFTSRLLSLWRLGKYWFVTTVWKAVPVKAGEGSIPLVSAGENMKLDEFNEVCNETTDFFLDFRQHPKNRLRKLDRKWVGEEEILERAKWIVEHWETVSRKLDAAHRSNEQARFIDAWGIGDEVALYCTMALDTVKQLNKLYPNKIEESVFLMFKIEEWFRRWPRSNPEREKRIMEDHAKGNYKTFAKWEGPPPSMNTEDR
jgi:hypothetical protein